MKTSSIAIILLSVSVSAQEPSGWSTLTSTSGGFRASFPARPQLKSDTVAGPTGPIRQTTHYLKSGGCLFTMQTFHHPRSFPPARVPAQLAAEKKGYLQGNVEVIREENVTVDGVDGEEFEYKGPSPLGRGRVTSLTRHFIKGAFYYAITVMSAPDQPLPPTTRQFMESLHFTGRATPKANATGTADSRARPGSTRPRRGSMAKTQGGGTGPLPTGDTPDTNDQPVEADMRQLEGTWRLVSSVANGRELPPEIIGENRIVYENGRKTVRLGNRIIVRGVKVTLDPTANPMRITESTTDNRGRINAVNGIYQIEGDTLTTCVAPTGKRVPSIVRVETR